MDYAFFKDIGGREEQQDAVGVFYLNNQIFMVLADGMGGHAGGAIASTLLLKTAEESFLFDNNSSNKPKEFFTNIIEKTKESLKKVIQNKDIDPNTTVIFVLIIKQTLYYAYIGDSRLYLFEKEKKLTFKTRDHSLPEMLFQDKQINENEISTHPQQNILTKSIGASSLDIADYGEIKLKHHKEYIVLIASDGLWAMLQEEELHNKLFSEESLETASKRILNIAKHRGGDTGDNISIATVLIKKRPYSLAYKLSIILLVVSSILIYTYFTNS